MNNIKIFISICALAVFVLMYMKGFEREKEIIDPSKKETIILRKKESQNNIHSIQIKIFGKIDGKSTISILLNDKKIYKTTEVSDDFEFNWSGDWYNDTIEIVYEPENVKEGIIIIKYEFKDL